MVTGATEWDYWSSASTDLATSSSADSRTPGPACARTAASAAATTRPAARIASISPVVLISTTRHQPFRHAPTGSPVPPSEPD